MSCQWGHNDCRNESARCDTCFSESFHYAPVTAKKSPQLARRARKQDRRQGSDFEAKAKKALSDGMADTVVQHTINSGATVHEKGDQEIKGLVTAMIEDKTRTVVHKARGSKTFTISQEWLEKLLKESRKHNKEFHWLLFSFYQHDRNIYAITEADHIISMIKTMEADRKRAKIAEKKASIAERRRDIAEAENTKLKAELAHLKECRELMEYVKSNEP